MLLMMRAVDSVQPGRHDRTLTLVCERCGEVYAPADAQEIMILGPGYARYECSECGYVVRSVPPNSNTTDGTAASDLIPAIVPIADTNQADE
jgi:rubredoxin